MSEIIRPVLSDTPDLKDETPKDQDVPKFVTRDVVSPLSEPPQTLPPEATDDRSHVRSWVLIGFGVAYLIGAGLYFGRPLLGETAELFSIAGLALLLTLPLILLVLLWYALGQLKFAYQQNARFSRAAEVLVSPDREAYSRSESLASAIRSEISHVNQSLSETVETLKDVQISVTKETQALDAAGLQLSSRSEDVGRNLTLQRQALESISGTFDTRMGTLSTQISATSDTLDVICSEAEIKLLKAGEVLNQSLSDGSNSIDQKITEIGEVSRKLDATSDALSEDIGASTQKLAETENGLIENAEVLKALNTNTQSQISDLQRLIGSGHEMVETLRNVAEDRGAKVQSYYESLTRQLKQSEDETLAAQGKTARMVETNLAQMRRDFARMETDLQALQAQLRNIRSATEETDTAAFATDTLSPRLNLKPLETDFPPVEPPRAVSRHATSKFADTPPIADTPLNLGMDMEIAKADSDIVDFDPDLIRRPGDTTPAKKTKGFGRRSENQSGTGWRWREMLGGLDRPDEKASPEGLRNSIPITPPSIDGVEILTALKLSPSAIVDEGTVIDATQARINDGEAGLVATVAKKLPEAVNHLRDKLASDLTLIGNLKTFSDDFADMIGNTPPTAPALRAALGSPEGRAYLLCAAALKG